MADELQSIRSISWREIFPFTLIFRTFRVAIHPSKLLLALLALVIVYAGGTVMDALTPRSQLAVPDELALYEQTRSSVAHDQSFQRLRDEEIGTNLRWYNAQLASIGKSRGTSDDLRQAILRQRDAALARANNIDDVQRIYLEAGERMASLDHFRVGLFETFSTYELGQVNSIVRAVRHLNFVGPDGVTSCVLRFIAIAPEWAVKHHLLFFTIFTLFFLCIWSVFGGAITRIAAVHVARDEKISIRQALAFSTSKFLSFVSAPIIPVVIVLLLGLVPLAAGIVLNLPFVGPIIVGATFLLVLIAAFLMTMVLLGLVGGANLMYPTIAVEGSDSFDAISRSFTYLYARPWRLAFYSVVAIAYGAITYLFVRYFIYILLSLAHLATGAAVFTHSSGGMPLLQNMWPSPTAVGRLSYSINWMALGVGEQFGAGLLAFWIYLVVAVLGAYAISFYFSVSTVIYFLMRREVDATEVDDVYLEQSDEDFGDVVVKPSDVNVESGGDPVAPVPAPVVVTPVEPPTTP